MSWFRRLRELKRRLEDDELEVAVLTAWDAGGTGDVGQALEMYRCRLRGDGDDICGFCGLPGADKIPHPVRWPGEESAGTRYVHEVCEDAECGRAHAMLSDKEREGFLRTI